MDLTTTISKTYRVAKQAHIGLFCTSRKELDSPIYHAQYETIEGDLAHISTWQSEGEAIKACARHASEEVKFSLSKKAGCYPD